MSRKPMRDYHMHTRFCRHAAGGPADYARAAREKGIREICFTPHIPLPGFRPGFWGDRLRMDEAEFDAYREELEKARALFPDLTILNGVEADYIEGTERYVERFLSAHDFDFVLMSVHFVASWPQEEWVFGFNRRRPLASVYRDYFRAVRNGAETGLFDCAAHLDLIKQPGRPVLDACPAEVEAAIDAILGQGMSLEINTSGARKGIPENLPCDDIVRILIQREAPLVTGSDAHDPSQVGLELDELGRRFGASLERRLVCYRGRVMGEPGTGEQGQMAAAGGP